MTQRGELFIDGGACCVTPDGACAVAEERVTRRKHAGGAEFALRTVLEDCGIGVQEVDRFYVSTCGERVHGPEAPVVLSCHSGLRLQDLGVPSRKVRWVPSHHLSHAFAAFESSDRPRALVVVMDDAGSAPGDQAGSQGGEDRQLVSGELERTTFYLADRHSGYRKIAEVLAEPPSAGGPGTMYRYVTDFLGLDGMTECGKTMALAAYGRRNGLRRLRLLERRGAGHVSTLTGQPDDSIESVQRRLIEAGYSRAKPRSRTATIRAFDQDLARRGQDELEASVVASIRDLIALTGVSDLCLSGGVALNCVLAGKLSFLPEVSSVHVAPAPGDTGQPLGNCLYGLQQEGLRLPPAFPDPYLGPRYSTDRMRRAVESWGAGLRISRGDIPRRVAAAISSGHVVGVFHGRSELGPRALGHRSILADARSRRMKDHLNRQVKGREPYRPYGGTVLASATDRLFGRAIASPTMMIAAHLSPAWRARLPAICHVDGTTRFQSVGQGDDPFIHDILDKFCDMTGTPAVLNTSFNVAGQPIVETPEDSIVAFLRMNLDALAIEDWYLEKV